MSRLVLKRTKTYQPVVSCRIYPDPWQLWPRRFGMPRILPTERRFPVPCRHRSKDPPWTESLLTPCPSSPLASRDQAGWCPLTKCIAIDRRFRSSFPSQHKMQMKRSWSDPHLRWFLQDPVDYRLKHFIILSYFIDRYRIDLLYSVLHFTTHKCEWTILNII